MIMGMDLRFVVQGNNLQENTASAATPPNPNANIYSVMDGPRIDSLILFKYMDQAAIDVPVNGRDWAPLIEHGQIMKGLASRKTRYYKILKRWKKTRFPRIAISMTAATPVPPAIVCSSSYFVNIPGYVLRYKSRKRHFIYYNNTDGQWNIRDFYLMSLSTTAYNFGTSNAGRSIFISGRILISE